MTADTQRQGWRTGMAFSACGGNGARLLGPLTRVASLDAVTTQPAATWTTRRPPPRSVGRDAGGPHRVVVVQGHVGGRDGAALHAPLLQDLGVVAAADQVLDRGRERRLQ